MCFQFLILPVFLIAPLQLALCFEVVHKLNSKVMQVILSTMRTVANKTDSKRGKLAAFVVAYLRESVTH